MSTQKYGWKPDIPDHRDHYFTALAAPSALPPFVDLRKKFPTAFNQLNLGSCTANAIGAAIEFDQIKQGIEIFIPSRLFIYYNERVLEGTIYEDAGATLRDGVKAVNKWGAPPEREWPYITSKFAVKPPSAVYAHAATHRALAYQRVNQDLVSMQSCLAGGYGFVLGFAVYESFESKVVSKTGVVPMPSTSERSLGGHAVIAAGYNDGPTVVNGIPPRHFVIRNSWGPYWGVNGYFFMPYEYLMNGDLAEDFWKISLVQ
jgi:C1A family cysteine protease